MRLTPTAPATQPRPMKKATSEAVGRPIQRLIWWKCRYCIQPGRAIRRQRIPAAVARSLAAPLTKKSEDKKSAEREADCFLAACRLFRCSWEGRGVPQEWQKRAPTRYSVAQRSQASLRAEASCWG